MSLPTITPGYTHLGGGRVTPFRLNSAIANLAMTLSGRKLLGKSTAGSGAWEEIDLTEAGLAFLQAANVPAQRALLGLDSALAVTYAANLALDLSAKESVKTLALTGDISFTTANRAAGRSYVLRMTADATTRNFTFPAWVFQTEKPTQLAANKRGTLVLISYGAAETDVDAFYTAES